MEVYKIRDYEVSPMDSLYFDTNVWLHIYGPIASARKEKQRAYSCLLEQAISRDATIWITSMVLSEYINRVLRIGFKQWMEKEHLEQADFKHDYRLTEDYKETLEDVKQQVRDILCIKQVSKRSDDFNSLNINTIIDSMQSTCDYNDVYIIRCCEKNNLKLVSDDTDMQTINSRVKMITA